MTARRTIFGSIGRLLIGGYIASRQREERKIGPLEGVPAMGLDGLGSSAYGSEAALTVLMPLAAAGLDLVVPIMALLVGLLAVLYVSYRQTITAYPSSGGAYVVARENLGTDAGLVAAAAIMIDYVLNVAVGISAGVAALTSAVPALHAYTLSLCLGILALITLVNLRGTRESGRLFAVPTYLFVVFFLSILALGLWATARAGGHPTPVVAPPPLPQATEGLSLWLLLRAFASGCTAMTGVEAVSNGVDAFREPVVRNAKLTLSLIVVILGLLLIGIAALARTYGVGAMDQTQDGYRSVLSQLAAAIVGEGPVYDVAMGSLLVILSLSANTSFVGFPRLCRLVASHGFLPKPFAIPGRRLALSVGILYLAASAALLLLAFGGITDRLIPLFAIGAFLSFTMSQAGMVAHWLRQGAGGRRLAHSARLAVNALGTLVTGLALAVIVAAKFTEGAWITVMVIPLVIAGLKLVRRYYDRVEAATRAATSFAIDDTTPPIVLLPTLGWDRATEKALRFAVRLSPDIVAVHLTGLEGEDEPGDPRRIHADWQAAVERPAARTGLPVPRLVVLESSYRRIEAPLLKLVDRILREHPDRAIAVVIPFVFKPHWWQRPLHTRRVAKLGGALMRYGGDRLMVVTLPYHVEASRPEEGLIDEERLPAPSAAAS